MKNDCICGSDSYHKLFDGSYRVEGTNHIIYYSIVKCNYCGVSKTYPSPPNHNNRYENKQNIDAIINTERYADKNVFSFLASDVLRFLDDNKISDGKLLDIGSGSGVILSLAIQKGFDATGIELSAGLVGYCQTVQLNALNMNLLEAKFEDNYFDVITMSQVLEHIKTPKSILKEIKRILKPGGFLIISVPNYDNIIFHLKKSKYLPLQPECHFWHFSLESLKRLLINENYNLEYVRISSRNYHYTKLLSILTDPKVDVTYSKKLANGLLSIFRVINNVSNNKISVMIRSTIIIIFNILAKLKLTGDNLILVVRK